MVIKLIVFIDTGVNGYAFIDKEKASFLKKIIRILYTQFKEDIPITGYNRKNRKKIIYIF